VRIEAGRDRAFRPVAAVSERTKDDSHVQFHGTGSYLQPFCDGLVGKSGLEQSQDFLLPFGQRASPADLKSLVPARLTHGQITQGHAEAKL
jgi:hypothetical protein